MKSKYFEETVQHIILIIVFYLVVFYIVREKRFTMAYQTAVALIAVLMTVYYYQLNPLFSYVFLFFTVLYISNIRVIEGMVPHSVDVVANIPCNNENKDDYLKGVDVIYWINLDRSKERGANMERLFTDPVFEDIDIVRVAAFDGKKPDIIYSRLANTNKKYSDVEYGCTLSHLECIRQFAESTEPGHDIALIMEDDATLEYKPYWRQSIWTVMKNAPYDWDIIQIAITSEEINAPLYKLNNSNIYSTLAYIINRKSAQRFIHQIYDSQTDTYTLKTEINHVADQYIYHTTNTYTYKYPFFTYPLENDSTIHPDHLPTHVRTKEIYDKLMMTPST